MGRVFLVYGTPLMAVPSFEYSVRLLASTNNDWTAVEHNL